MKEKYSIAEHTHRFAVWTAARAVQRSFTTTQKIEAAIDKSDLRKFAEKMKCKSQNEFDSFHERCANQLINALRTRKVKNPSYGRAAKIIAIYLKTSIVVATQGKDKRCRFIHPPIDRKLLQKLPDELKSLKKEVWTGFDKNKYQKVVTAIRSSKYPFNWELEKYWRA